jgi:uncharacterized protein with HEPN domain
VSAREWQLRAEDILEAIARIQRYTAGLSFANFETDDLLIDAVIRNFIVIGEAARNIPPEIEARHPQIPWTQMRGLRNVVVHVYFAVDARILWQTIQADLPPLVPALQALLEQEG